MPVKELADDSGAIIKVLDIDGYLIPAFNFENQELEFRGMTKWAARDSDILISAYPKSGTHWIWEIVNMLVQGSAVLSKTHKESVMLEAIPQSVYDALSSPRVMNTHLYSQYLPTEFWKKKTKMIYIVRNPKDVAVSYYNHHCKIVEYGYIGQWNDYIKRYLEGNIDYGTWFDYTRHWEKFIKENPDYPIHTVHYENMKQNGVEEIEKLSKFLGIEKDKEFLEEICKNCQFDNMKTEKNKQKDMIKWKDDAPGMYRKDVDVVDNIVNSENSKGRDSITNTVSGEIGDWKNWFTVAQNEHFDSVYEKEMKDSDTKVQYDV